MGPYVTSRRWQDHFLGNSVDPEASMPWSAGAGLTEAEARAVVVSLQAWQLGETSEGGHLLAAARRYAAKISDPEFLPAVKLFIAEEQRHGELLGRFLDLHGAGRIRRNWGDTAFRLLRYALPNLEIWTTVVIGVETLALIYYRAVMQASRSRLLQAICRQILKDEVYHLRFQYERLAQMQAGRGVVGRWITLRLQRVLFFATTIAVWVGHRRALRAGGFPLRRYWRAAWNRMEFHWRRMRPDASGATRGGLPAIGRAETRPSRCRTGTALPSTGAAPTLSPANLTAVERDKIAEPQCVAAQGTI